MKKCVEGKISIDELKPIIKSDKIYFPISTDYEYVKDDGRSFGYPVDDGWVTHIEYDFTVGVLTENTIDLIETLKNPARPSEGAIATYEFSIADLDSWKQGLDNRWAEDEYEEWQQKGLIDDDETKGEWIADRLDNYHCWPNEWRKIYDAAREEMNKPIGEKQLILSNGDLALYFDGQNYFFTTKYYDHGKLTKADKESALIYIEDFKIYEESLSKYNETLKQLKENLEILRNTLTKQEIK